MKRILFYLSLCCLIGVGSLHSRAQQANTPPTAPKPAATSSGSLTGRVVDEEEQPQADVEIMMFGRAGGASRTTVSDEEGKFSFASLAEGQYIFTVRMPAYIQPDSGRAYRTGETVTLKLLKGGVITGRVTNARGEPVVAVSVSAQRMRNASDAANERASDYSYTQRTDDRGVYRLYGLQPGAYLIVANAPVRSPAQTTAYQYQKELPSYHPSGPRETAQAVEVRAGAEATGIDIRYVSESGHSISGTVAAVAATANAPAGYTIVSLHRAASGEQFAVTNVQPNAALKGFVFAGVPEGEYELIARSSEGAQNGAVSAPRRVSVKNTDIADVTLTLLPLGSLAGRVVVEAAPPTLSCAPPKPLALDEVSLPWRRMGKDLTANHFDVAQVFGRPNAQGEFVIRGVAAGAYYPFPGFPGEFWYVRALTQQAAANARPTELSRTGITFKTGENLTGVTISLAPGAASLWGRVVSADQTPLPELVRVYLVPAENTAADDLLRYAETLATTAQNRAGRFAFGRLAPGRYRLFAEAAAVSEPPERRARQAAWEPAERARLRRLAETQPEFELKACERVQGYELRLK